MTKTASCLNYYFYNSNFLLQQLRHRETTWDGEINIFGGHCIGTPPSQTFQLFVSSSMSCCCSRSTSLSRMLTVEFLVVTQQVHQLLQVSQSPTVRYRFGRIWGIFGSTQRNEITIVGKAKESEIVQRKLNRTAFNVWI